ncbi:MAG: alkaline phosphatase family protein [Anaerolineaceae bacterium]|nr:alkaline phosphatase family protein [Anaerolineaceae bacterium]MDE0330060.1 alkaline phosphatase family protein [Anaerolineaceae bacterium]
MRLLRRRRRLLLVGLDGAGPQLAFESFANDLPTLGALRRDGTWGELRSCIPCITVPAWSSMFSGRDPGEQGVYGFRQRAGGSYQKQRLADSRSLRHPRAHDLLGAAGRDCLVMGLPQTWPVQPLRGHLVSGPLTPGLDSACTWPAVLRQELQQLAPDFRFDVQDFRAWDRERLLRSLVDMAEQQHRVFCHLLRTKRWDFALQVHMGLDRVQHVFWSDHDPQHRNHAPDGRWRHALRDFYIMLDDMLGDLMELAGDDCDLLVVSDHGAKRMDGGICVNEWLWREGWLRLKGNPPGDRLSRLTDLEVDWANTRAWAEGGYCGRIWLNVAGREPQGCVSVAEAPALQDELAAELRAIRGPGGQSLPTQVYRPGEIYREVQGLAPNLLVYFGDLHWRAIGTLGHGRDWSLENDSGPDGANHAMEGLFVLREARGRGQGKVQGRQLMDIAPTILKRLGVPRPPGMQGRAI